jgi:hypothetical protein
MLEFPKISTQQNNSFIQITTNQRATQTNAKKKPAVKRMGDDVSNEYLPQKTPPQRKKNKPNKSNQIIERRQSKDTNTLFGQTKRPIAQMKRPQSLRLHRERTNMHVWQDFYQNARLR